MDTKAKLNVGAFSRGGTARGSEAIQAWDHDLRPKQKLVPCGILEVLGRPGSAVPPTGLVTELADLCAVHLAVEERVFYPGLGWMADEAPVELERLVAALLDADFKHEPLEHIARGLRDEVREHAADQERRVFPAARRSLDAVRLRRLAYEMRVLEFEIRTDVNPRLGMLADTATAASA